MFWPRQHGSTSLSVMEQPMDGLVDLSDSACHGWILGLEARQVQVQLWSNGPDQWLASVPEQYVSFVVVLVNGWPWFTWWLNHLPGPSISLKRTPM